MPKKRNDLRSKLPGFRGARGGKRDPSKAAMEDLSEALMPGTSITDRLRRLKLGSVAKKVGKGTLKVGKLSVEGAKIVGKEGGGLLEKLSKQAVEVQKAQEQLKKQRAQGGPRGTQKKPAPAKRQLTPAEIKEKFFRL